MQFTIEDNYLIKKLIIKYKV